MRRTMSKEEAKKLYEYNLLSGKQYNAILNHYRDEMIREEYLCLKKDGFSYDECVEMLCLRIWEFADKTYCFSDHSIKRILRPLKSHKRGGSRYRFIERNN